MLGDEDDDCQEVLKESLQKCLAGHNLLDCEGNFKSSYCQANAACSQCSHDAAIKYEKLARDGYSDTRKTDCPNYIPPEPVDKPWCSPTIFTQTVIIIVCVIGLSILFIVVVLLFCCCGCAACCCACGRGCGGRRGRSGRSSRRGSRRS